METVASYSIRPRARVFGKHVYGNLYGCDPEILRSPLALEKIVVEAALAGNMNLLDVKVWKIGEGISVVAVILESHISIHTWPEHEFATADVYSCGSHTQPEKSFEYIARALKAKKIVGGVVDRTMYEE